MRYNETPGYTFLITFWLVAAQNPPDTDNQDHNCPSPQTRPAITNRRHKKKTRKSSNVCPKSCPIRSSNKMTESATPTSSPCEKTPVVNKGFFERLFDYFRGKTNKQNEDTKKEAAMCQRCPLKKKTQCCAPKLIVRKKTACSKCGASSKCDKKRKTKWALDEKLQTPVKCVTRRVERSGKDMDIWVDGIKCAMPVEVVQCG